MQPFLASGVANTFVQLPSRLNYLLGALPWCGTLNPGKLESWAFPFYQVEHTSRNYFPFATGDGLSVFLRRSSLELISRKRRRRFHHEAIFYPGSAYLPIKSDPSPSSSTG
jgi:hypothetical protein